MSDTEPNELDREVSAAMRMFQKSQVGSAALLTPIEPNRVLLVLDGSTQDASGIEAALHLQDRHGVEVLVQDARDRREDEPADLAERCVDRIPGARALPSAEGEAYDVILAAIDANEVDLVIVPCPYGRDFDQVGTDSAGTVIDVLLSRCPCAFLVIRRADQPLARCIDKLSVVVGGECDVESKAASWAFGLSADHSTVTLNLVVEKEQYENIRSIVEALSPGAEFNAQVFSDALTKAHQAIHSAMANTAKELNRSYHLLPQAGEVAPPNPLENSDTMLIVLPLEVDDRFGQGFVHDRVRRSPHPVLVVPSHVDTSA